MANARAWLAARAGAVPPALEARMETAVDEVGADGTSNAGDVSQVLGAAGLMAIRGALERCDERAAALHLLAADALVTSACAAAAGAGDDALDALCAAFAPERLASLTGGAGDRGS